MIIRDVRSKITQSLPQSWVLPGRNVARIWDQMMGAPFSPWRKGNIAMFHFGRCGSTVVGNMLDKHNKIRWDGEVFYRKWANANFEHVPFDTKAFIRRQMLIAGSGFYGFEMKIHPEQEFALIHVSFEKMLADLKALGFTHFVILERKNYLRRMVSQIAGAQTQRRHIEVGTKPKRTQVKIDPQAVSFGVVDNPKPLLQCFEEIEQSYRNVEYHLDRHPLLKLSYEQDVLDSGPQEAYRKICDFIGVEPMKVDPGLQRTNPYPLSEIIENYTELEQTLKGTRYEWMLWE